jgi:hypothetical protein
MEYDIGVPRVVTFTSLPSPNDERGFGVAMKMQEVVPTACVSSERFFACGGGYLHPLFPESSSWRLSFSRSLFSLQIEERASKTSSIF